ncbi:hypothetical protein K493DRAFT_341265 [Basidiobolus meristosporus CBS 931.73]|uniref:GmrSD restriction endonucleases N-terminal domain-containing protein n=1 Tax=Basidiobolus meristosporus CBS 931.73 TaxID=1314790 RepID=A0A1Y1XT23_9FUNG|nr:hypothetical protein K493DRAFT_341265 [Basidiobolus meristosporus CBS 931.73]|eukprot:ORX88454.1 hypothetical protein K493DRAFT_341265 [Basidiobolus meristosporus CBS 931.73]
MAVQLLTLLFHLTHLYSITLTAPEFQRDVVWPEKKMSHLIDSVLKNFYVPPVIFSCKRLPDGRVLKVCIDGKQRLTAIRRFMSNEIPHLDPFEESSVKRYYKEDPAYPKRKTLTLREQEDFQYSEFVCIEYTDLTPTQEHEIFSRVQLGVALSVAEKLQAIASPMSNYVRTIIEDYPALSTIMDTKRARPFLLIGQALHIMHNEPDRFISTSPAIEKFLKRGDNVDPNLQTKAKRTFETYSTLIRTYPDIFETPTKMAPIEFVMFSYVIARYPERNNEQLRQDLRNMRDHVRNKYIDIRFNTAVYNCIMDFIVNIDDEMEREPAYTNGDKRDLSGDEDSRLEFKRIKAEPEEGENDTLSFQPISGKVTQRPQMFSAGKAPNA